jgi:hypothetical protein
MDKKSDLTAFMNNAPIITIIISEQKMKFRVFFSMNCCKKMFEYHEQGDDYRSAFAKAVFPMYQQISYDTANSITERDFLNTTNENLIIILNTILEQDGKLKFEYDNVQADDVYERFYKANKAVLKSATADISKSILKMSETFGLQNKALSSSLGNAMKNFIVPPDNLSELTSVIANIPKLDSVLVNIPELPSAGISYALQVMPKIDFPQFQSALENVSQIQFPKLASAIANIPKPVFDIQNLIAPLQSLNESMRYINDGFLAQTLQTQLLQMTGAAQSLVDSIDFSLLAYRKEWSEQRETLLEYEWFYSDELPDELVNHIHENKGELSVDEVDKLIVNYFRDDRCKKLKSIVKQWSDLPYFYCRTKVFHEALVNHSRRYFNSSVILLTVHIEGVITDFVRTSLKNPRFKVETAIEDIKKELAEKHEISIYEYEVFTDVIEQIEVAFNENFKISDPDATSNKSRHKIAHGHAYEPENEVNSLKRFLYLNEIYYLFSLLHKQGQE